MKLSKKILIKSGIFFTLGLILSWALLYAWLPHFIKGQIHKLEAHTGLALQVAKVEVSPWNLSAKINDVQISYQKIPLAQAREIYLNVEVIYFALGRIQLSELTVDDLDLYWIRDRFVSQSANPRLTHQYQWNVLHALAQLKKAPQKDAQKKPIRIDIDLLQLRSAKVAVDDRQNRLRYQLDPVDLTIQHFSNHDENASSQAIHSDLSLKLANIQIPIAGSANRLEIQNLALQGRFDLDAQKHLQARLKLQVDDGYLKTDIKVGMHEQSFTGSVQFENFPMAPWISLLPANVALQTRAGVLHGDLNLVTHKQAWALEGSLQLNELQVYEKGMKEELLSVKQAIFEKFRFNFLTLEKQEVSIQELRLIEPDMRMTLGQDKQSNFRRMFAKPEGTTASPTHQTSSDRIHPKRSQALGQRPNLVVDIRAVKLQKGRMHFSDQSLRLKFDTRITEMNGSLLGVSNVAGQSALIALDGLIDRRGSVRARGQISFDEPKRNSDVSLQFKNVPLRSINPYSMTFAGYYIDDGRIDVDLSYTTQAGELRGKNRFVIRQMKLGDEVPDYTGKRLPIRLAIALLEDSDGMIDINIPISGHVDAPEFSVGHLFWQALRTVITNVVTAPFRAIASLLGSESIDGVYMLPGESGLMPQERDKLDKILALLEKRTPVDLEIAGSYDPERDALALKTTTIDQQVLIAAGFKLTDLDPLPQLALSDPRIQTAIRQIYTKELGYLKLSQRLVTLPLDGEQRALRLRAELIQSRPLTERDLLRLADQRLEQIERYILKQQPNLKNRLRRASPVKVNAVEAGVPIQMQLKTK